MSSLLDSAAKIDYTLIGLKDNPSTFNIYGDKSERNKDETKLRGKLKVCKVGNDDEPGLCRLTDENRLDAIVTPNYLCILSPAAR